MTSSWHWWSSCGPEMLPSSVIEMTSFHRRHSSDSGRPRHRKVCGRTASLPRLLKPAKYRRARNHGLESACRERRLQLVAARRSELDDGAWPCAGRHGSSLAGPSSVMGLADWEAGSAVDWVVAISPRGSVAAFAASADDSCARSGATHYGENPAGRGRSHLRPQCSCPRQWREQAVRSRHRGSARTTCLPPGIAESKFGLPSNAAGPPRQHSLTHVKGGYLFRPPGGPPVGSRCKRRPALAFPTPWQVLAADAPGGQLSAQVPGSLCPRSSNTVPAVRPSLRLQSSQFPASTYCKKIARSLQWLKGRSSKQLVSEQ